MNIIKQGKNLLIAACDSDLLGKTLKFGKINLRSVEVSTESQA